MTDNGTTTAQQGVDDSSLLFHKSLNSAGKETIILLHGLFCSHIEFDLVAPLLAKDYHVLLVDLPEHSGSRSRSLPSTSPTDKPFSTSSSSSNFTLSATATHLAALIRARAHNSRAHLVGVSLGGFCAMRLTTLHPELVSSLTVTGCTPLSGTQRWLATHPAVLYPLLAATTSWAPQLLHRAVTERVMKLDPAASRRLQKEACIPNFGKALTATAYAEIAQFTLDGDVAALGTVVRGESGDMSDGRGIRVLVLSGEAVDDVSTAREMGRILRERKRKDGKSDGLAMDHRAALVSGAQHLWDMQFPQLFADSVTACIDGNNLPDGLVLL
ncbi:Alpha/Beta hydrolase protein [Xylariaceae sp. FL0255]|nr:Alpha/Beta hydrolase protein [Xylariaceae sp. FL0255]